ncbi:sugar transferase [Bacillus paranthracis]|uniref:sugar transferase n=1 Tax=Bacillus cereus group TaxID=86661 RepID=UPI0009436556|nr:MULTISPECIES: sugar transferase [Bacillus cereus group]ASZ16758.1 sugar transferase [Bacillus cereus]MBL3844716.1 sugar transferase [Bacillus cereus]MDA1588040.1 sugar transferase [Bacillus cereus group sp. TH225LC]MDA1888967.1 sugar transferase [Bacillus cereus group sp. BY11-1LC]MDA2588968.1 sugar transferase [Bacillus cereus group sp. Bc065]
MKRIFDVCISLLLLFVCLLPIFVVAILVRMKLGSPVLFTQQRPGQHGKPFNLYKFRTMLDKKGSDGELLPDQNRLTAFGAILRKYSLDELPQLINVVRGDLSLVGPRPLLMEYLPLYSSKQAKRHNVKPGITGWAQINGRNLITWEEKFELDVWYVENRSFLLDLKIIVLTILKVFKTEGINHVGHVTMERFTGEKIEIKGEGK